MNRKLLIIFILVVSFLTFSEVKAQPSSNDGKIPNDLKITLETTECYGECPVYKLTVNSDETVIFEGKEYTKVIGETDSKISKSKIKELINEFETNKFFSLRDAYVSKEDGCTEIFTDMPSVTISIELNGKRKYSAFYLGCSGKANKDTKKIIRIINKIMELTDARKWIK